MPLPRVSPGFLPLLAVTCLLGFADGSLRAAPAAERPAVNANPASQTLLSRLPDPSAFKQSPLENAVRDTDPVAKDPTYQDLQAAVKRKDFKRALNDLRTLNARYPDRHPEFYGLHGIVALHERLFGEAETAFRHVTRLNPKKPFAWYCLALAEAAQGHVPAAASDARASVKASDSFAPGWMLLAICQEDMKQRGDAVASATHATRVAPNESHPWLILAQCKMQQGNQASAVGDLEHARRLNANDLRTNELLGSCYVQLNQPARALGPYQQALKVAAKNPAESTAIYRQLGYCYLATGNTAAAEQACRQGIKLQPGNGSAWDMLGLCYRREGKQREAVDAFEHAVKASPRDLNARTHLDEARLGVTAPRR